jgi:hypothetical protein
MLGDAAQYDNIGRGDTIPCPYQGMCLKTPARISSAAAKAATTAQLSRDKSQFFFSLAGFESVLMVYSFESADLCR